jgi:hypothetical protein
MMENVIEKDNYDKPEKNKFDKTHQQLYRVLDICQMEQNHLLAFEQEELMNDQRFSYFFV